MKKLYIVLIVIVITIVGLSFVKNFLIKSTVEFGATQVLGAPVHIGSMSVGLFSQTADIKALTVQNPAGFPDGELLNITHVRVDYDLAQVLKGNIHLRALVLNLKEMNLIKDKNGKLNVNALKIAENKDPNAKVPPFTIDTLVLDLGKVHYWDYSFVPPGHHEYDINIHDKTYHDIKSAEKFAALVMMESLTPTKVKSLVNFGFNTVDKVFGTVKDAGSLIKGLIKP